MLLHQSENLVLKTPKNYLIDIKFVFKSYEIKCRSGEANIIYVDYVCHRLESWYGNFGIKLCWHGTEAVMIKLKACAKFEVIKLAKPPTLFCHKIFAFIFNQESG